MIYEELIPADHLLCKLSAAADLSFVSETVSDCYCPDNGHPSWDPLVTGGQMIVGRRDTNAIGSTSLAEGLVCFVGLRFM